MSKPPIITLRTPSSAVIELLAHKPAPHSAIRYSATLTVNNFCVGMIFASTQPSVDAESNLLIMDGGHLDLLGEYTSKAVEFLTRTEHYVEGLQ